MKIKKFNEELRNPKKDVETVGELIDYLKQYDLDTKVAVSVAEEPSPIVSVKSTVVKHCPGRGDDLEYLVDWDRNENVILIGGNQY